MGLFLFLFALLPPFAAHSAVGLLDTYYSPLNRQRPVRKSTRYIVLHTTEGACRGAGEKLQARGEAHYMVDRAGRIYRIIDRKRIAYHCGRSMWNGRTSLDDCSVGIEVEGYHNKDLTKAQTKALRELIQELKKVYGIPDDRVLTHSMVAYGAPNQWHRRSHRGRKRCAMRMALPSARRALGLMSKPEYDPDVKAGRLIVADKELHQLLYSVERKKKASAASGAPAHAPVDEESASLLYEKRENTGNVIGPGRTAWDIARDAYNAKSTVYELPDGMRIAGDKVANFKTMKSGTKVFVAEGESNEPEKMSSIGAAVGSGDFKKLLSDALVAIAGEEWNSSRTVYVLPKGAYYRGDELDAAKIATLTPDTSVLSGYRVGGPVTSKTPAFNICGAGWQSSDTFFLPPGEKMISGDKIDPKKIKPGTMVFYKD